jgi:Subtilase family
LRYDGIVARRDPDRDVVILLRQIGLVLAVMLGAVLLLALSPAARGQSVEAAVDYDPAGAPYAAGELIVTHEEEVPLGTVESLAEEARGEIEGHLPTIDARLLEFPEVKGERSREVRERVLARIKEDLESVPAVESVDYNYLRTLSFTPNDPGFDEQWGLIKAGFEDAWSRTRGKGVRIAVVDSGAEVINCSFTGPGNSRALKDAIDHAARKGAVVVAAAGNGDTDRPKYPAAYPGVIAAAATNQEDQRTSFSNFGSWVGRCRSGRRHPLDGPRRVP